MKQDFHVGDRVLIRSWDDMLDEFNGDQYSIDFDDVCFPASMRRFCGMEATITNIFDVYDIRNQVFLDFGSKYINDEASEWVFCTSMIEPILDDIDFEPDESMLLDFLRAR